MKYYLGIDLGGTNIVASVVDETYKILSKASIKTASPRPAVDIMDDMVKVSREACEKAGVPVERLEWVGIGAPGTINRDTGYIEYSNNLQFDHVPLRQYIADRLGRPVFVDNDANAAAYGEALAGAAKGVKDAVAITLGTGVGGGIIIDGKIYSGFNFAGAELGHAVIEIGGRQCTCGRRGCLEAYASATGLINLTKEAMEANPNSKMWTLTGGTIDNVSGKTAFDAMREGDAAGKEVVDLYIKYLGCGLANYINIFQPEVLCIGGGICKEGETLLAPLREYINSENFLRDSTRRTRLCVAELGNDAGIIGAAFLGKSV